TLITGDPVRVQQVCWNILRNAVKFTSERGTISIITGNDDHNNVWVRVTDTGIGFTHDLATRIFEPFEQGGRHITRQFGGLGLAETGRFDLIISDLGLPDLSGHKLMRRLHTRFNLPGIALSGYGMETDLAQSREAGFKYHLTKPVSFDQLKSFVAEFAARREAAPEAVPATP